jgi:hypothetical protein
MEVGFSFPCPRSSPGQSLVQSVNVRLGVSLYMFHSFASLLSSKQFEVFCADAYQESSQQVRISR